MHRDVTLVAIKSSNKLKYLKLEERKLKTAKEVVIQFLKIFPTRGKTISCHIHFKEYHNLLDDQRQSEAYKRLSDPATSNAILFDESPSTSEDVDMRETETCSIEMRSKSTQTSFKPAKVSVTSIKTQTIADTT